MAGSMVVRNGSVGTQGGPDFPRVGGYIISGAAASWASPAAKLANVRRMSKALVLSHWIGRTDSITGDDFATTCSKVQNGDLTACIAEYLNPGEIAKSEEFLTSGVRWDLWQDIIANNRYAYTDGTSELAANRVTSWFNPPNFYKLNYTQAAPVRGGKNWMQFYAARSDTAFRKGGVIQTSATTSITQAANPALRAWYIDNVFWRERPNVVLGSGAQADYNRDGTLDNNNNVATGTYPLTGAQNTRQSYAAMAAYLRSIATGLQPYILCNSGDWYYSFLASLGLGESVIGSEYDQVFNGGVLEELIGTSGSIEKFTSFKNVKAYYDMCMAAYRAPKLGIVTGLCSSLTAYGEARYIASVTALNDGFTHAHATDYNIDNVIMLDEYSFNMGKRVGSFPTAATFQDSSSNPNRASDGSGIWVSEFEKGVILTAARRGLGQLTNDDQASVYPSFTLPYTVWRLRASSYANQDPTTNNAAQITAGTPITMTPRTGLFLSKTAT